MSSGPDLLGIVLFCSWG